MAGTGIGISLGSGSFTVSNTGATAKISGDLVQRVVAASTTVTTGATVLPVDNTPPQITEGNQFLVATHKPTASGNKLLVKVLVNGSQSAGNCAMALYASTTAASSSAVSATTISAGAGGQSTEMVLNYATTTADVASVTWIVRAGGAAGTFTLNGQGAAGLFGNLLQSYIVIDEVQN